MANLIHAYDGATLISEGDGSAPLVVGPLNATNNEVSAPKAVTIKCDTGYKTYGDVLLSFNGTTGGKWSICATSNGTYGATLTISSTIDATTGVTVYVKAQATSDETPVNDATANIHIEATIQAA